MEASLGVLLHQPLILNPKPCLCPSFNNLRTGFLAQKMPSPALRKTSLNVARDGGDVVYDESKEPNKSEMDWELEFLGEIDPLGYQPPKLRKKRENSRLLGDTEEMDWCVRARKIALKSIESRGLSSTMESLVNKKKKKKKAKNKLDKKLKTNKKVSTSEEDMDSELDGDIEFDDEISTEQDIENLREKVNMFGGGMFEEKKEKMREEFIKKLSQFSGPSDRRKEINLNKEIVEAQTADEVLEVTADVIMAVGKGLSPSPLSPLNIATALHRIAKNMEKVSMMKSHRLAFARQREMSLLVATAMAALPECSAQGVSNISWALSKIGGELLYLSEMDRVAEVALSKIDEFNSQNVANIAGAFASMQHSASDLFEQLSKRSANIIHTFQEKELAQLLWAFASLHEPADTFLDSLDYVLKGGNQLESFLAEGLLSDAEGPGGSNGAYDLEAPPLFEFSRDQLGNLAWSYAVLGQLDRSFFCYIWNTINQLDERRISDQSWEDVVFASQVRLVNQCLKLEYPHLQLSLKSDLEEKIVRAGRSKRFNQKVTSSFQKEVARLLVSTGLDWVREYDTDGYTVDAALIDRKIALEIDGPTHFSRNTGVPLGHTMLKRRYITAAGWKLASVSHQEWEELQGEFEQLDYLREILKEHIDEINSDGA